MVVDDDDDGNGGNKGGGFSIICDDPRYRIGGGNEEEGGGEEGRCYGAKEEKKWRQMCMLVGRCLSGVGMGRLSAWRWERDFVMVVEVYLPYNGGKRLLCEAGHLSLKALRITADEQFIVAACENETPGLMGHSRCWAIEEVMGVEVVGGDPMGALCNAFMNVEVMLVDKRNNRMAIW